MLHTQCASHRGPRGEDDNTTEGQWWVDAHMHVFCAMYVDVIVHGKVQISAGLKVFNV